MTRSYAMRIAMILAVIGCSAVAAFRLASGAAVAQPVPAHVVAQQFRLSPVETSRLSAVYVAPGDRIRQGQLLARFDTSVLEHEMAVVEARLEQLGAETDAVAVAMQSADFDRERSFQSDAASAAAGLDAARAEKTREEAELRELEIEIGRLHGLIREGLTTRDRADELELKRRTLAESIAAWPGRIEGLSARREAALDRLRAWRQEHSAQTAPALREVRVKPARRKIAEVVEAQRVLRARIAMANLIAPSDGEVVSVSSRAGDVIRAGDPFLILQGDSGREVIAYLPERDGRRPRTGCRARIQQRGTYRQAHEVRIVRVSETIAPLPARFWPTPQLATWGREVVLELPSKAPLQAGEAVDIHFHAGGASCE